MACQRGRDGAKKRRRAWDTAVTGGMVRGYEGEEFRDRFARTGGW